MHGLSCETLAVLGPPGLHTTAQELQTRTFEGRGFQSHHQFHKTTSKRGRKNENSGARGKICEILAPTTLRGPDTSGPNHSGPQPSGTLRGDPPPPDKPSLFLGCCLCCFALILGPPGFHTTAREPKRAHLRSWSSKHHQNSTRRPPEREEKNEFCGGRGEKSAKFWPSTLRGLHPSGPTLRGLHPSGPPPFLAPTLLAPTLLAPTLLAPTLFLCLGPHPFGPLSPPWPPIPSPYSSPTPPHPQKCPQLTVAKVGETVAKTGRGQTRKSCWPKAVVAKVGRARFCCVAAFLVAAFGPPTVEPPPPPLQCLTFQNVDNNFSQLMEPLDLHAGPHTSWP